tara:strand:- start:11686 stop:13257 length:1572 start_codon:yes stop_codon:yes gene_type:complete
VTCSTAIPGRVLENPLYSRQEQVIKKAVIFDIDETILNTKQRYTDAIRAGVADKDGLPVKKKMMSDGAAWKKRNEFIYSAKALGKDKPIPGAKTLMSKLEKKGYTIIYLTARPKMYQDRTINQLREKNFPIHRSFDGGDLVFSKSGPKKSFEFKAEMVRQLQGSYQIDMVFDDDQRNLDAMRDLGIPGLYDSIKHYTGYTVKENPHHPRVVRDRYGRPIVMGTDDPDLSARLLAEFKDKEDDAIYEDDNPPKKPLPKPRRKKLSNGKYRLEPAKQYKNNLMFKNKQMQDDFPDTGQRYAVIGDLVKKYYGKAAWERIAYKGNPSNLPPMPPLTKQYLDKDEMLARGRELANKYQVPLYWTFFGNSKIANYQLHTEPRDGKIAYGHYEGSETQTEGVIRPVPLPPSRNPPKKNPASKSKIKKAEKLYRHMNNKAPEKIETKKIDIGDVWYQVGEGGCWQIGYMSGKEDGNTKQKYSHTFNEETKDGNFPQLYATMPENGKPMLVITGGTWKIKTDDKGIAWIYD